MRIEIKAKTNLLHQMDHLICDTSAPKPFRDHSTQLPSVLAKFNRTSHLPPRHQQIRGLIGRWRLKLEKHRNRRDVLIEPLLDLGRGRQYS